MDMDKEIMILCEDHLTKQEARKYLSEGRADIYDVTAEPWDDNYAEEFCGITLDEIKKHVTDDISYVEYEGREYVIVYTL